MDIFKLIYEHDIRLDELKERPATRKSSEPEMSLEDFMKPDPTFSKFYFTGTDLSVKPAFGLNVISNYLNVLECLDESLKDFRFFNGQKAILHITDAIDRMQLGTPLLGTTTKTAEETDDLNFSALSIDKQSNIGQRKTELRKALEKDWIVLYKEKAHNGFDLHIFSRKNIYRNFFFPLQKLSSLDNFRFFSVNGKRINSERKFYFETWTLKRPPHGAEEVLPESVL